MNTVEPPARPAAIPRTTGSSLPSFFSGLRGIWLMTWKTRLTLRQLPVQLVCLFILPLLIYLTTSSLQTWSRRHALLGQPGMEVYDFTQRLGRSGARAKPEQTRQLLTIFSEEYARAEREAAEKQLNGDDFAQRNELLKTCYERIHARLEGVLDENQTRQFNEFEKRRLAQNKNAAQTFWTRTAPFYHWLIDFYFFVIMPLICVGAAGSLIREELQANTLVFLTTRPLTRARLLILKYLCQTAWLQIVLVLEAVLLFAAGGLRHVPELGKLLILFVPVQILAISAWSALGAFLGLITKRFMPLALVYGFIVEMGIGRIPTNINTLSVIRNLKTLLSHNAALQGLFQWSAGSVAVSLTAVVLGTAFFVTLASLLFTFKEYHHTVEMQK